MLNNARLFAVNSPMALKAPKISLSLKSKFANILNYGQKPAKPAGPVVSLACDFGKSKIVFLQVKRSPEGGVTLERFHKFPRPEDPIKIADALKQAFQSGGYSTGNIRISVKGQGVIVRFVQFPKMKPEDLRSSIGFEVEQYIPFKAHEVAVDFQILDDNVQTSTGVMMNVLLVAVKKEDLYNTMAHFQGAELQVELIDVDALCAVNALEFAAPEDFKSVVAVIDIGTEISNLSIVQNGAPKFIRDISFGGVDILKRFKRKLGLNQEAAVAQLEIDKQPSPEAAEILKESIGDLVTDIKLSLNYYLDQVSGAAPIQKIFLMGGGGYHPIVLEVLSSNLGIPAQLMDLLSKVQIDPSVDVELVKKNQGLLTVALGLCLRDL